MLDEKLNIGGLGIKCTLVPDNYYDKILCGGGISLTVGAIIATMFIPTPDMESSAAVISQSLQGESFKRMPIPQIQPNLAIGLGTKAKHRLGI